MDNVGFLNSSGAIISPPPSDSKYAAFFNFAPYVETMDIPAVTIDSSAIYGEHPENLATLTYSSGAALTFFCDSVQGGDDTSGDGSFDNPWRSLNTASRFLSCASCVLSAAAPYTQLKIRGTVDYVSSAWAPWGQINAKKLILTGWGEKCDLGSAKFHAEHFFGLKVKPTISSTKTCSGCTLVGDRIDSALAVDCEFVSGGTVSCAYNCSGGGDYVSASICYAGSIATNVYTNYAYGTVISGGVLGVSRAAAGVSVTAVSSGAAVTVTPVTGGPNCNYLGNCTVTASAVAEPVPGSASERNMFAYVLLLTGPSGLIVSGGTWQAFASASATGADNYVNASAIVSGFESKFTVVGVSTTFTASAGATFTGQDGREQEYERIASAGQSCWIERVRYLSSGMVKSSYISSGGNCGAFMP